MRKKSLREIAGHTEEILPLYDSKVKKDSYFKCVSYVLFCFIILIIIYIYIHSFLNIDIISLFNQESIIIDTRLTFWSSDFHISPVADIKNLLAEYNVHIIDKSLSGHCHLSNTCERDLKVINTGNGIKLGNCPNELRKDFYNTYKCDNQMANVDAFLCTHADSMCELFMPFNTSMIVIASTRYEIGRHESDRWELWNNNLRLLSANPNNIIAANNLYDQEYIKYFTGIKDVILLPSFCGYIKNKYFPTKNEVLIAPARGVNSQISNELFKSFERFKMAKQVSSTISIITDTNNSLIKSNKKSSITKDNLHFSHIRDLYPEYKYTDLSSHTAIVLLPYQVSFMSLFEFYRMEIPMFVPSPQLLASWHESIGVLNERTWDRVYGDPSSRSKLKKHPKSYSKLVNDPNNEFSYDAILEWIQLADFYQLPFITQFSTWDELMGLLISSDLQEISNNMAKFNIQHSMNIKKKWNLALDVLRKGKLHKRSIFNKISNANTNNCNGFNMPNDINIALNLTYKYHLKGCKQQKNV